MPLADRAMRRPHTVRAFRDAAGARFRDAARLADAGHRLGAIYLYGYVAEMLLKAAYFRGRGWGPDQPVAHSDLYQAKQLATSLHNLAWPGNLHDLGGWVRLLIRDRHVGGRSYPGPFRNRLVGRVNVIYRNWREGLRYHDMRPYAGEVDATQAAVSWLLAQYRRL
jgi:hypothetical protein